MGMTFFFPHFASHPPLGRVTPTISNSIPTPSSPTPSPTQPSPIVSTSILHPFAINSISNNTGFLIRCGLQLCPHAQLTPSPNWILCPPPSPVSSPTLTSSPTSSPIIQTLPSFSTPGVSNSTSPNRNPNASIPLASRTFPCN